VPGETMKKNSHHKVNRYQRDGGPVAIDESGGAVRMDEGDRNEQHPRADVVVLP
jgi:hypothetical protein